MSYSKTWQHFKHKYIEKTLYDYAQLNLKYTVHQVKEKKKVHHENQRPVRQK
jgi:hypothetical protein